MAPRKTTQKLAIAGPTKSEKSQEAQALPVAESLIVPASLLLAAETISEHKNEELAYLCGVFLHAVEGKPRVVATDGQRLFVASFDLGAGVAAPNWLDDGVILSNVGLKARVGMIAKEDRNVCIELVKGAPIGNVMDTGKQMVFRTEILEGEFPDYTRSIPAQAFTTYTEEGDAIQAQEWAPVGINSKHLKHVENVSKLLEAGLAKEQRPENGMVVRAFNSGDETKPMVFDFTSCPGVILVVATTRLVGEARALPGATAAILAPAVKLTLAALRAHQTRNLAWAEEATSPVQREQFEAKAAGFEARIATILKQCGGLPAIAAPDPTPQPDPESEADNAEQDAADAVRKSADPEDAEGQEDLAA